MSLPKRENPCLAYFSTKCKYLSTFPRTGTPFKSLYEKSPSARATCNLTPYWCDDKDLLHFIGLKWYYGFMNSDILLTVCFHATHFVILTVHFLYLKVCFTLILNKLIETPLFAHWGGQQGGVMYQLIYTEDINNG